MHDAITKIRKIIKEEVQQAGASLNNDELGEMIDERVKGYLETIGDRIPPVTTNEKNPIHIPDWQKGESGTHTLALPIHKKSISAYQSVAGASEVGTQPYRTLVQNDVLAGAFDEERLDATPHEMLGLSGASKFFVTRFSGLSFSKVSDTSGDTDYEGSLTAEENVIENFESRMRGTVAAFEDLAGLRNAVVEEFMQQLGLTRLQQWFSKLSSTDFTKKVTSGVANKLPTGSNVIQKMSDLMLQLESQYREMPCVFVLADRVFSLVVNASSNDGEWVSRPGDRDHQRYALFGFPVIPLSSQFPTVNTTGSLVGMFLCPYMALKLGIRKDLFILESEHNKLGSISFWANSRFKYATKDVNAVAQFKTGT